MREIGLILLALYAILLLVAVSQASNISLKKNEAALRECQIVRDAQRLSLEKIEAQRVGK